MVKKTVKYKNFEGKEITKDLYFHLTKFELTEYSVNLDEPIEEKIVAAAHESNSKKLFTFIKEIMILAYGEKCGDDFIKSKEIRDKFEHSEAFSELFMSLANDEKEMSDFFNAIIPEISAEDRALAEQKVAQLIG